MHVREGTQSARRRTVHVRAGASPTLDSAAATSAIGLVRAATGAGHVCTAAPTRGVCAAATAKSLNQRVVARSSFGRTVRQPPARGLDSPRAQAYQTRAFLPDDIRTRGVEIRLMPQLLRP